MKSINMATITTRQFKNGNSMAVRIPIKMSYPEGTILEIEKIGNELRIKPQAKKIDGKKLLSAFSALKPSDSDFVREDASYIERDWS